jgi:hypothetical protein
VNNEPIFVLIQRCETIPYILFVTNQLHKIKGDVEATINKMTNQEKMKLLNSKQTDYIQKYRHILQQDSDAVLEWSFPKGRKSRKELYSNGVAIAVREFEEETIFKKKHIEYIFKNEVYQYTKQGSDNKLYRYILYPALVNAKPLLKLCEKNISANEMANPKDLCIIFPNKTNETSNVSLMGINKINSEKGIQKELSDFLTCIYDDIVNLSLLVVR